MSVTHPSPRRIEALRRRWTGQEARLRAIARSIVAGEDWTVHLLGLPLVEEIPPRDGEVCGRDLRGADLRHYLYPDLTITEATEVQAAIAAGLSFEGQRNNTPLPDASPFAADFESAEDIAIAMRRGDRFLLARLGGQPIGVVRIAVKSEFSEYTGQRPYGEISGLAVATRARRLGAGAALVRAAEMETLRDGHDYALLRTTLEIGLVPWYERLGYETRLIRQLTCRKGTTILDVVMARRLRAAPTAVRAANGVVHAAATRARHPVRR
jgi:GNAT superfamily N-acetyltransferase